MKLSEYWLKQWVNYDLPQEQIFEQLTNAGFEIEACEKRNYQFDPKIVIGEIAQVTIHPEAPQLKICQVYVSAEKTVQIITKADPIVVGSRFPVALPGAKLTTGVIQQREMAGLSSEGMLCSLAELGIFPLEQLWRLPADAPLGEMLSNYIAHIFVGDDHVIEFAITPNRGDCLSIQGMAREIAAITHTDFHFIKTLPIEASSEMQREIKVHDTQACPRYLACMIENIDINRVITPIWMQLSLMSSGIRCINIVVDIMNYVMLEVGQPLHAFDIAKINGNIQVRFAKDNESLQLLDGQTVTLKENTLLIADDERPLALAGIMGGLDSAVSTTTQAILIESAHFNVTTIAGRARQYGLLTDAAYRFERGVDPDLPLRAMERAVQLIQELLGNVRVSALIKHDQLSQNNKVIDVRLQRLQKILGFHLNSKLVLNLLQRLNLQPALTEHGFQVQVPSYRFDLALEEDIIEEIVRLYGYQQIPVQLPREIFKMAAETTALQQMRAIKRILMAQGYHEAITYSFVDPELQRNFLTANDVTLNLANPISSDLSQMRVSLWLGLLQAVIYNLNRQQERVRLFEAGMRFLGTKNNSMPLQQNILAGIATGSCFPLQWAEKNRNVDFFDVKSDVSLILDAAGIQSEFIEFKLTQHPALHPGQSAEILKSKQRIGLIGSLHPKLLQQLGLTKPVLVFELLLDALLTPARSKYHAFSAFPMIRRDLSFVVKCEITASEILTVVQQAGGKMLRDVTLFDVYQGEHLDKAHKSLALALFIQSQERTLVEAEIQTLVQQVVMALKQAFDIQLRDTA